MFEQNSFEYFSNLAEAGDITFTPQGKVRQAKYPNKRTKQPMWNVAVNVDGAEGFFCLDDHAMAKQLELYAGNEITAQFALQGKTQKLKIISAPEGIKPESSEAPAKRSRLTPKQGLRQIANAIYAAKKTVLHMTEQGSIEGAPASPEQYLDDVKTVMIYLNSHGLVDQFPTDYEIWSPAQKQEALEKQAKEIFKAKELVIEDKAMPTEPEEPPCQRGEDGNFEF